MVCSDRRATRRCVPSLVRSFCQEVRSCQLMPSQGNRFPACVGYSWSVLRTPWLQSGSRLSFCICVGAGRSPRCDYRRRTRGLLYWRIYSSSSSSSSHCWGRWCDCLKSVPLDPFCYRTSENLSCARSLVTCGVHIRCH